MPTEMNITVNASPNDPSVQIINISGELDTNTMPKFQEEIDSIIQDVTKKYFIFNLKDLEFIGSRAIGYFVYTSTTLNNSNRHMALAEFNLTIADIFSLVGLDKVIPCYATLGEALKNPQYPIPNPQSNN